MAHRLKDLSVVGLLLGSALISWYGIFNFDQPLIAACACWAITFCVLAYANRHRYAIALLYLNLAAGCAAWLLADSYYWYRAAATRPNTTQTITPRLMRTDTILGYEPIANNAVRSVKATEDTLVYDVTYSIDPTGLRVSPDANAQPQGCILFFGGSYTFGEGVEDWEAMPFQVGEKTAGAFQIYNFGISGHGPHQMLAAIEFGLVEDRVDCDVTHIVYQAIQEHIRRVSPGVSWGLWGPKYVIQDGEVVYIGRFSSTERLAELKRRLSNSELYRRLRERNLTETNLATYFGVVEKSQKLLSEQYPNSQFHILLWNHAQDTHRLMSEKFAAQQWQIHSSDAFLPQFAENRAAYQISPAVDNHPTGETHSIIAEYVVTEILRFSLD